MQYQSSVRAYLQALVATGARVVWQETTMPVKALQPEKYKNVTTVAKALEMNALAGKVAAELGVAVISTISENPDNTMNSDGVHLMKYDQLYYKTVMRRILLGQLLANGCDVGSLT